MACIVEKWSACSGGDVVVFCIVERAHDDVDDPLMNSVEFVWRTTTVAVGDTAVLHCSFDAIFQQLRTGSVRLSASYWFTAK